MKLYWQLEPSDTEEVRVLVEKHKNCAFVKCRQQRNVQGEAPTPDRASFWKQVVTCLMTTQQKSGPNAAITDFLATRPFPLAYEACVKAEDIHAFADDALRTAHRPIRWRGKKIASEVAANWGRLADESCWQETRQALERLCQNPDIETERATAEFVLRSLKGFGPKQSRNLLQSLGLTRHEIPIDSRVIAWMNKLGLNVPLSGKVLADSAFYRFVLDQIQEICDRCGVLPCILDAAIYCRADKCRWTEERVAASGW